MNPIWFDLTLAILAAARITQLITHDTLLERPRNWITVRADYEWTATLIGCPHCAGFWISLLLASLWITDVGLFRAVAAPWAVAWAAGHLVERTSR